MIDSMATFTMYSRLLTIISRMLDLFDPALRAEYFVAELAFPPTMIYPKTTATIALLNWLFSIINGHLIPCCLQLDSTICQLSTLVTDNHA